MTITHEVYLKNQLWTKKQELQNLNIQHQIELAKYNLNKDLLFKDINSIEKQLNETK